MKTREEIADSLRDEASRELSNADESFIFELINENPPKRPNLDMTLKEIDEYDKTYLSTLADLIDPTCETEILSTGDIADYECREHFSHCLSCGCTYGYVLYGEDGDVSMDELPQYCPHCGARVVSSDE